MRILVTGCSGYLGSHLVKALLRYEWVGAVIGIDLVEPTFNYEPNEKFNFLKADLRFINHNSLPLKEYDLIFHFAALNGTKNFYEKPLDVLDHAFNTTRNLIEILKGSGNSKFVFASTSELNACGVSLEITSLPSREDDVLVINDVTNPRWSYAVGKLASEVLIAGAIQQHKIPYTILRFHNVYGRMLDKDHVISDMITRIKKGIFEIYGADQTRSFIHIDDAINATIEVALSQLSKNSIINIGTNQEIRIYDLYKKILKLLDIDLNIETKIFPAPEGSVHRRVPDLSKLERICNVTIFKDLDAGLQELIYDLQ